MVLIDRTHKNKPFLEYSVMKCKGVARPKTLGAAALADSCEKVLFPSTALTALCLHLCLVPWCPSQSSRSAHSCTDEA